MSRPLLTVALPTFNRARLLEGQLSWLSSEMDTPPGSLQVLVSDNSSTDSTPEVIEKWRSSVKGDRVVVRRHDSNIGAVRNIASCISSAEGEHVWVLSDDDSLREGTVGRVLEMLKERRELGLLTLNYRTRSVATERVISPRCYAVDGDVFDPSGLALFERCVVENVFGVATTTAQIYSAQLAREAVESWPEGLSNLAVQIYWGAYCANKGGMLVTADAHMDVWIGAHYFSDDPLAKFKLRFSDMSEVGDRMVAIGYPGEMRDEMVLRQLGMLPYNLGVIARAVVRSPGPASNALSRWLRAVARLGLRRPLSHVGRRLMLKLPRVRRGPR